MVIFVKFDSMKKLALFALVVMLVGCEKKLIVEPNDTVYFYLKSGYQWYHTEKCNSMLIGTGGKCTRIDAEAFGAEPCPYCCFEDSEYAPK